MKRIVLMVLFAVMMINADLLANDTKKGAVLSSGVQKSEKKNGEIKTFYGDETKIKTIYNYSNGKLNGIQKEFYENGKVKAEYEMKNGLKDGSGKEFYEDGTIAWERNLTGGKGIGTEYYPNGMKKRERIYESNRQIFVSKMNHDIKGEKYQRNAEELFAEGQEYGSNEMYYHAIKTYEDFLLQFPKHKKASNVKFLIAFTYNNQLNDVENARKHYNEFMKNFPNDPLKQSAEFELKTLGKSLDDMPEFKK